MGDYVGLKSKRKNEEEDGWDIEIPSVKTGIEDWRGFIDDPRAH
jgi:hypothetical protein